MTHHVLKIAQI